MTAQPVISGPKGNPLTGNLREFNQDTLRFMLAQRDYGDLTKFRFGPFEVLALNHPDYVHDVLVENADKYQKLTSTKQILAPVVGNGLFTSEGDFWKRQRRLVQPAFHAKRIGAYAQLMVDYTNDLANEWATGGTRAIERDMTKLTMRIIAKTLFDSDVTHEASEVGDTIRDALAIIEDNFRQIMNLPYWLPTPKNLRMRRIVERLDRLIQRFIDERRASNVDKGDFLSLLLSAQDEDNTRMTDKQVRDEAMTLFGAGHETTSVTLSWAWYLLSQHPEIEAKLQDEVKNVLSGRLPTLEDLPKLTYTEKVIKETMRLYPAAWSTTRESIEETDLKGYPIKNRQAIMINIYGMHHDSRFFSDPEKFDPERFSAENEKYIPKYAYIPFGGGPRVCIGNAFSLMEARLILATLVQRFELRVSPGFEVVPDRQFTLKPKYGLKMEVKPL